MTSLGAPSPQEQLTQASALLGANRPAEALPIFERLRERAPGNPFVRLGLAACRLRLGAGDEARAVLRGLRAEGPSDPAVLNNLGNLSVEAGDVDEGLATLKSGMAMHPSDVRLAEDYVALLSTMDRSVETIGAARAAIDAGVRTLRVVVAIAASRLQLGEADEAVPILEELIGREPGNPRSLEWLARVLVHDPAATAARIRSAHEGQMDALQRTLRIRAAPARPRRDDPERPLRVAFLSGDFNRHSVAYFVLPLLEGLRSMGATRDGSGGGGPGLDLRGYHTQDKSDDVTARIEAAMPLARVRLDSNEQLVRRIKNDRIDVLIELAGLTTNHRHAAMLYRCAPVQATFLGWPSTTGNPAIDFRLVDSITDPPGSEAHCTERLVRLDPCAWCHRPPDGTGEPREPEAGRPFTFASFNNQTKIVTDVVRAWARILDGAPEARLLVKNTALREAGNVEYLRRRFVVLGIPADRLDLVGWVQGVSNHLALYDRTDVALDPFPYHGTTTTCESLYMGVPVLTIEGDRHSSRVGVSLLRAAGMPEWVARDVDEYVRLGIEAARRGVRSRADRLAVRAKYEASPIRDEAGYARRFADAVRWMWRQSVVR